jgi:hypothetical protein
VWGHAAAAATESLCKGFQEQPLLWVHKHCLRCRQPEGSGIEGSGSAGGQEHAKLHRL